jgi:LacI family transcriptional regulator
MRALREAGVEVAANRTAESDFTSTGGYAAAAKLLSESPPSAIFASNDMIGFGVLRARQRSAISACRPSCR